MSTQKHDSRSTVEQVADAVGKLGRHVLHALPLASGLRVSPNRRHLAQPGTAPGIEHLPDLDKPPPAGEVEIECIDYCADRTGSTTYADVDTFLQTERPAWATNRWVNVNGLHPYVVNKLRTHYKFHTLSAEDMLHIPQRPKVDPFDTHLFVIIRMMTLNGEQVNAEQVSLLFFGDLLLTVQERSGDIWAPVRARIERAGSRIRTHDTSFLLYALIDAVVDHSFPILEQYGDLLDDLERSVISDPQMPLLQRIHAVKRQLVLMRRIMWPLREAVDMLYRNDTQMLSKETTTYMRDVYDHAIQVMDIVETHREMAAGLTELYMSAVGNKMNEVMKVLTIMASLFIPITFLAGVYGMNFTHMPELELQLAYPLFWLLVIGCTAGLLYYFRRKGWLG